MHYTERTCRPEATLWKVIEMLNLGDPIIALVVDEAGRLLGTITDGDIRRALLANLSLDSPASAIMNRSPKFLYRNERSKALSLLADKSIKCVPLVDENKVVVDLLTRSSGDCRAGSVEDRPNRVFIMAGGKGTRLAPLTRIIPKPLIPIDDKPLIEHVIDRFTPFGFKRFVISLNYKGEMIESYFQNYTNAELSFVRETEFLGTAGSLSLAREQLSEPFFLVNCDVLTDVDFADLMHAHVEAKAAITLVGVLRKVNVPYGIIELEDSRFASITEKPQYSFLVNGGVYVLDPAVLDHIAPGERIDMPDLIMRVKNAGLNIGVFPTSGEWVDVGTIDEYRHVFDKFYNPRS